MDYNLPGSSIRGIFQARVLEWVAISFSKGSSQPRDRTQVSRIVGRHFTIGPTRGVLGGVKFCQFHGLAVLSCLSHAWLCVTLWTVTCQAPLSMGFSRQGYWSGLLCPPPGDFPNSGIEPWSLKSPALAGGIFTTSATWEAHPHHGLNVFKSLPHACFSSPMSGKQNLFFQWETRAHRRSAPVWFGLGWPNSPPSL